MSRKYRVEQKFTTGWGLVSETSFKLSKDEAKKILEELMAEGVNPDSLRAIPGEHQSIISQLNLVSRICQRNRQEHPYIKRFTFFYVVIISNGIN